jgi:hypothetical protein
MLIAVAFNQSDRRDKVIGFDRFESPEDIAEAMGGI